MAGEFVRVTAEIAGVPALERAAIRMEGATRAAATATTAAAEKTAQASARGLFTHKLAGGEDLGRIMRGLPIAAMGVSAVANLLGDGGGTGAVRTITGMAGMGAQGVMVGSLFGPLGAAIGGVSGALIGLVTSINDAREAERARAEAARIEADERRARAEIARQEEARHVRDVAGAYALPTQLVRTLAGARLPRGISDVEVAAAIAERAPSAAQIRALTERATGVGAAAGRLGVYASPQMIASLALAGARTGLGMGELARQAMDTARREVQAGRARDIGDALSRIVADIDAAATAAQAALAARGADITAAQEAARAGAVTVGAEPVRLRGQTEEQRVAEALSVMALERGAQPLSPEQIEASLSTLREQAGREERATAIRRGDEMARQISDETMRRVAEGVTLAAREMQRTAHVIERAAAIEQSQMVVSSRAWLR